jgi:hypothetical protein
MPSYPNFPFFPAGSDGIDDDGLPNDWFVPANAGAVASNYPNAPAPAAAPNPAPPAPNPQPNAAPSGPSNQPAPARPDPFAAFWALIPASRVGALAWAPPIFPSSNPFAFQNIPAPPPPFSLNSPRQFPSATPAPLDDLPPAAANGLFGSTIGRMLAERAKSYDPFEVAANGMWGGIAKMIAANAAPDPSARGFLGSLADLPVPPSAQAASYAPYSGPFLPSDPIGFPQSSALPDLELIADKTKGPRNLDLFDERAFGETPPLGSPAPRMLPRSDQEPDRQRPRQSLRRRQPHSCPYGRRFRRHPRCRLARCRHLRQGKPRITREHRVRRSRPPQPFRQRPRHSFCRRPVRSRRKALLLNQHSRPPRRGQVTPPRTRRQL